MTGIVQQSLPDASFLLQDPTAPAAGYTRSSAADYLKAGRTVGIAESDRPLSAPASRKRASPYSGGKVVRRAKGM